MLIWGGWVMALLLKGNFGPCHKARVGTEKHSGDGVVFSKDACPLPSRGKGMVIDRHLLETLSCKQFWIQDCQMVCSPWTNQGWDYLRYSIETKGGVKQEMSQGSLASTSEVFLSAYASSGPAWTFAGFRLSCEKLTNILKLVIYWIPSCSFE